MTKEAIIRAIAPECGWNPIPETIPAGQEESHEVLAVGSGRSNVCFVLTTSVLRSVSKNERQMD